MRREEQTKTGRAKCHPTVTQSAGECYHEAQGPAKAAPIACAALSSERRQQESPIPWRRTAAIGAAVERGEYPGADMFGDSQL